MSTGERVQKMSELARLREIKRTRKIGLLPIP